MSSVHTSNMLMIMRCNTHLHILFAFNAFMWIIFYAFIDSFIFLIDIIYTIVNQTLHSIKNKQLVILKITWKRTHSKNQFDRWRCCYWWERMREAAGNRTLICCVCMFYNALQFTIQLHHSLARSLCYSHCNELQIDLLCASERFN